jgi:hypothetical protein
VWTPNLQGMTKGRDGSELLLSIHGQSSRTGRPVTDARSLRVLRSRPRRSKPDRWLNTWFLVGEGEIDESRENWWLDTYVCMNEQAQGAPALGSEPPKRYRQRSAAEQP